MVQDKKYSKSGRRRANSASLERKVTIDDDREEVASKRGWHDDFNRTIVHAHADDYNYNQGYNQPQQTTQYTNGYQGYGYPAPPTVRSMIPVPTPIQPIKRHPKNGAPIVITNQPNPVIIRPKYKPQQFRRKQRPNYEVSENEID